MKKKESKGPEFSKDGHVRPLLIWVFEIAVVLVLAAVGIHFFLPDHCHAGGRHGTHTGYGRQGIDQ